VNFSRNTNMIATLVATVLCGCPGLFGLCFGISYLFAGFTPGAEINIFGNTSPDSATGMGVVFLCVSLIALAMPLIIWFATRRKGTIARLEQDRDEPIPPAT
jgi:hypothetical protein